MQFTDQSFIVSPSFLVEIPRNINHRNGALFGIDQANKNEEQKISAVWDLIDRTVGTSSKTDRFYYTLLFFSNSTNILEAIEEWDGLYHRKSVVKSELSCICSQDIEHYHFVKNSINDNILRIGSVCINKFCCEPVRSEAKVVESIKNYEKNGNGKHRMCAACNHFAVKADFPSWRIFCKSCMKNNWLEPTDEYKKIFNYRSCVTCGELSIPPTESWKTQCKICYDPEDKRPCETCGELSIPVSAPEYRKQCTLCFKEKKMKEAFAGYRPCSICDELKIPLTDPHWKKLCSKCYINSKK